MKILLLISAALLGLNLTTQAQERTAIRIFQEDAEAVAAVRYSPLAAALKASRPFTLATAAVQAALADAPLEGQGGSPVVLALPLPDGSTARFAIVEAPVMEPGLAAQFPDVKTYAGYGLDDAMASIRLDLTPRGFHAQMLSPTSGTIYIDPVSITGDDTQHYLSFYRKDMNRAGSGQPGLACGFRANSTATDKAAMAQRLEGDGGVIIAQRASGTTLRTYRLAMAATREYTAYFGGTVARAQAAIVTTVNRVVGVYEKELAVRMVLVANNSSLIYTATNRGPYINSDADSLLEQNQRNLTAVIGTANYDIGHVVGTAASGLASLGVVCDAQYKAQGTTGIAQPVGDSFDIDYVAHEMGHQFGAEHTFNSTQSSCGGGNRNASTAYEPGSGTTIMAYAGICGTGSDLQSHSDAYFHTISYQEIQTYLATTSCAVTTPTGNIVPVVTGPASGKTLPISTPFKLKAVGSDANGDALTYCWEEFDLGAAGTATTAQVANRNVPIFRSFTPDTAHTRYFPKLSDIIANTTTIAERLPTVSRTLTFRCTARDQHVGTAGTIGGVSYTAATTRLSVSSAAGPFQVTVPNSALSWPALSTQTVTWNVANTNQSPVSCALVNIRLSTNGGLTYPILLSTNQPNTGTATVILPGTQSTTARLMVEAADNYFFDISDTNFTISAALATVAAKASAFAVFPNPVPLGKSLQVALVASDTSASYTLRNVLGQTVASGTFSGSATEIPVSNLAMGTYLLSIAVAGDAPLTQRVVLE